MPTFYLDDEPIEFEDGESVLRAALRQGKDIPHYCFHPGLKTTAQCRMCLVDVVDMGNGRGMPKLQTSCSTPAAEGMKVVSKSDKVHQAQNTVNEFLLVNHPLDCAICDHAGECDLQNIAFQYGSGQSEMEYEKRVYGWREVGTFLVLERNRCIHCSRCERFSREIVGTHDFGQFLRSHELTYDTYEDKQITHRFQGNLADICPVGCIMNRDWRFKKRAWKLEKTPSVCTSCSTGCNITIEQDRNQVYRLKPRENEAVNRWWMCDEGRINFRELNDRENRLLEPLARVGGKLVPAGWEAVYAAVAARVKALGASGEEAIGLVDTHATNEEMAMFRRLMEDCFGGAKVYYPFVKDEQELECPVEGIDPFIYTLIHTDKSPNTTGAAALKLTGDAGNKSLKAALKKKTRVVIVVGSPLAEDSAVQKDAQKADLIIHIGTTRAPWAEIADVALPGWNYAEKQGSYTNRQKRVQAIQPALRPPEMSREPLRIMQELMTALGKPQEGTATAPMVLDALGQEEGAFKGVSWQAVVDSGKEMGQ